MNDVLFELLKLIVMIAVLLIMRYAIPWIRSRIGVEKMAEIEKWAETPRQTRLTVPGKRQNMIKV